MEKMLNEAAELINKIISSEKSDWTMLMVIRFANIIGYFDAEGLIKIDDSDICHLCIKYLDKLKENNDDLEKYTIKDLCLEEGLWQLNI